MCASSPAGFECELYRHQPVRVRLTTMRNCQQLRIRFSGIRGLFQLVQHPSKYLTARSELSRTGTRQSASAAPRTRVTVPRGCRDFSFSQTIEAGPYSVVCRSGLRHNAERVNSVIGCLLSTANNSVAGGCYIGLTGTGGLGEPQDSSPALRASGPPHCRPLCVGIVEGGWELD